MSPKCINGIFQSSVRGISVEFGEGGGESTSCHLIYSTGLLKYTKLLRNREIIFILSIFSLFIIRCPSGISMSEEHPVGW
jgi:hypothetical protein